MLQEKMDFEEVLNVVGPFGAFQKRYVAVMLLALFPSMILDMRFAFIHHKQDFHCSLPPWINVSKNDDSYEAILNATIPWELDSFGVPRRSRCKMYAAVVTNITTNSADSFNHSMEISCRFGYHFDEVNSATTEFEMVCEDSWREALAVTITMTGATSGALLGYISDRFGRKRVFVIFKMLHFLFAGLVSLSWNYVSYVTFSLIMEICAMINYGVGYVLATETVGVKRHLAVGIGVFVAYTSGYMTSPLVSYLTPNWRWFLRFSLLGIFYIPIFWYLPESLRWCMVSKNEKRAKILLKRIAHVNHKKIDVDFVYRRFQEFQAGNDDKEKVRKSDDESKKEAFYFSQCLFPTMRMRYLVVCQSWMTTGMMYFAISVYPAYLSGNLYLNVLFTGAAELPSRFLAYKLPRMFGRIRSISMLYLIAGTCCAISPFLKTVNPVGVTILVLLGKTAVTTTFSLIYVIGAEISPTLVRSTSIGVASLGGCIGGIVMPFMMLAGDGKYDAVPYLTMGISAIVSAILFLAFVPETSGIPMPDSLEMALGNRRIYGWNIRKKFKDTNEPKEGINAKREYLL